MSRKLSKQVSIAFLGCLLVRVPAQAVAYSPTGQSGEQAPAPAAQQSPEELQQLVAPIALYPDAWLRRFCCFDLSNRDRRGRPVDAE